ncbi:MAG: hypothetical protein J1F07_09015 [Muribaculaceae bacterium]|nr:hypothetical protein [Muribaculaceae bacterium]
MIEDKEDFFEDSPADVPKKVKPPKQPKIGPDDPLYYEREEDRWEHLKPSPYRRGPLLWIVGAAVVAVCILLGLYVYIFTPQVDRAVQYGYVDSLQREGRFFHTYEGVILPYKSLMDSVRPYEGDFVFSTTDEHVAAELYRRQGSGTPVRVGYEVYRQRLPWRGASKVMVVSVDSVDPATILPPDRQPEFVR